MLDWKLKLLIHFQRLYIATAKFLCTTLLEKYPTFFFCVNLVEFNEARLHEATLNLRTHAWILPTYQ